MYETILAGYDGTVPAERALARAAELARTFGSKVVVVSAAPVEPVAPVGAFGLAPYYAYRPEASVPDMDEARWQEHRGRVQSLYAEAGVPVAFAGVVGHPVEEIVALAEQNRADLIVVGTRAPGFVERLLGGSVSQGVARRARCDVLIVHPPDGEA
jgi:nucleotide-binding universal stress UspA family protein